MICALHGSTPQDIKSAEVASDLTFFQFSTVVAEFQRLHLVGSLFSHSYTVVTSLYSFSVPILIFKLSLGFWNSCASNVAAHNCSLEMERRFTGATFFNQKICYNLTFLWKTSNVNTATITWFCGTAKTCDYIIATSSIITCLLICMLCID